MSACGLIHSPNGDVNPTLSAIKIYFDPLKRNDRYLVCYQCQRAPCVDVCEVEALYLVDGIVRFEESRCTKCGKCVDACPFNAIFFNTTFQTIVKCDLCVNFSVRYCEEACPVQAISLLGKASAKRINQHTPIKKED